ncbi:hypothetical protein SAMN04488548_1321 [Gordonia westfalica]|uniref:Uncharacterized protein n=1 Tax=Gordonia westfalica TaxID=158898 RepID=A0A1H2EI14_9ACTN|nr:hypothetical protein SAMN04488548_1321 [Gordonia westfalica]
MLYQVEFRFQWIETGYPWPWVDPELLYRSLLSRYGPTFPNPHRWMRQSRRATRLMHLVATDMQMAKVRQADASLQLLESRRTGGC